MAPALSSGVFGVSTGLYSKPDTRTSRPNLTVCARTNPFGAGKAKAADSSEGESQDGGLGSLNKLFDFGKVPDAKSLIPVLTSSSTSLFASSRRKDPNTVFVAGATGISGTRIAQTLLRQGFVVRAGVPELESAQELARLAATYKAISPAETKRLNAVEAAFDEPESIAKAIGPATKVVVTIGPGENGPATGVTTNDALRVIQAARLAGVGHVAVVYNSTSLFSGQSSTYNVLDGLSSFWSNLSGLFSNSQTLSVGDFLSKVVETGVSYTLIKAALAEDYSEESSRGLVVSKEGTSVESKVTKSQIAKLVADVFSSTEVAENKVVEVSTSPSATSKPVAELFSAIPEDGRRKAYEEALAKAKAEEEALIAAAKAKEAANAAKKLEEEAKIKSFSKEPSDFAKDAGSAVDNLLTKAKDFSANGAFSWEKLSSQLATTVSKKSDEEPATQVATVRGRAKARSLLPRMAVVKPPAAKPKPKKPTKPEQKPEVRKVLGGLFKQETIYIDDD